MLFKLQFSRAYTKQLVKMISREKLELPTLVKLSILRSLVVL